MDLKKLNDYLSPLGWLFVFLAVYPPIILILQPSFKEFLLFFLLDSFCLSIIKPFESKIFFHLFPETTSYFHGINEQEFSNLPNSKKLTFVESCMSFPRKRALFCTLGSFIKVIPGYAFIVYYWQHDISNLQQFLLIFLISCLNFCYFYGAIFLESHIFISKLLATTHKKYDLSDAFDKVQIRFNHRDFEIQEFVTLMFIALFVILLQAVTTNNFTVLYSNASSSGIILANTLIAILGSILFARIWYLGKKYFVSSLENLFHQMAALDKHDLRFNLALHTAPSLAQFEKTFNALMNKLRYNEQELSSLILTKADQGKYQAIGEISALIAHDLSSPLHVIQFCISEIQEKPYLIEDKKYLEQINTNIHQCVDLITSLRARIKNSIHSPNRTTVIEAHNHVVKLLATQFRKSEFDQVKFELQETISSTNLDIKRTDLIHVLDNLYRNSIHNMLSHSIKNPTIKLEFGDRQNNSVTILIRDNGTGLRKSHFEDLTAYRFTSPKQTSNSMGLRLTRRLVELNNGSLNIADEAQQGACFLLSLPISNESISGINI